MPFLQTSNQHSSHAEPSALVLFFSKRGWNAVKSGYSAQSQIGKLKTIIPIVFFILSILFSGLGLSQPFAETLDAPSHMQASLPSLEASFPGLENSQPSLDASLATSFAPIGYPSVSGKENSMPQELSAERNQPLLPMTWGDAFDKHAPLAFFSVGSLAVGGIIVGIRSENRSKWNAQSGSSDRDITWALGMAGITSMIAGGAFWYYSHKDMTLSRESIDPGFTLAPTWQQGLGIAAHWRLPLQSLFP
jgi:hypothetical protein